ncbi:MAG: ATP-binding protein [Thermoplasmata archaeon]|nr:ATP-binding protein [Thermoplasmata archaeon]
MTEFKAAAREPDYALREATAALHNAQGGEVLLGVTDGGRVEGSPVTLERVNETLRQSRASPAPWRVTDLLQVTANITRVPTSGEQRWAYVIEVRPSDLPAFALDSSERLVLPVRSGSDTRVLDAAAAVEWYALRRRGEVLRSCYRELATFSTQLSQHRSLPEGLPDPLPYIQAIVEDGTAYTVLKQVDRAALFGAGITNGRTSGAVDVYYRTLRRVKDALARREEGWAGAAIRDLRGLGQDFGNLEAEVRQSLDAFARHVRDQGFILEPAPPG